MSRFAFGLLTGAAVAAGPLVSYDFMGASIPAGMTFSRTTTGTRYNSSGVRVVEAIDAPRFDYAPVSHALRGLLYEGQVTNLMLRSQELDDAAWTVNGGPSFGTVTANAIVGPDGTLTCDKFVEGSSNGVHAIGQTNTVVNGQIYTWSWRAKAGERGYTIMNPFDGGVSFLTYFDISTGAVLTNASGTTALVEDIGGGFFRVSVSRAASSASHTLYTYISTTGADIAYAGVAGNGIYLTDAMLELGSVPSSFIPTAGSAVTRAADVLSFTIPSGVSALRYIFDDNSTQDVSVSPGAYTIPTTLNRTRIKSLRSWPN